MSTTTLPARKTTNRPGDNKEEQKSTPQSDNYTLEQKLFHALHDNRIHNPTLKEFKECFSFLNTSKQFFLSRNKQKDAIQIVIDVAGGHGALGALFLIVTGATEAVVIDPASERLGGGVYRAWKEHFFPKKIVRFRNECLRSGLPSELEYYLHCENVPNTKILVVACHACQHLTEETMRIAERYGVNIAVMPCCHKDHDGWWKAISKRITGGDGMSVGTVMDLLSAGKMMHEKAGLDAGVSYLVKMKLIDESITPQNRIILCKSIPRDSNSTGGSEEVERAHLKLQKAYIKAHEYPINQRGANSRRGREDSRVNGICKYSTMLGMAAGFFLSILARQVIIKSSIKR